MAKNQNKYIHLAVAAMATGAFGTAFDAFWHLTRGRESFIALPHLFIYGGAAAGIIITWYAYRATSQRAWVWMFRTLCLIPLSGPLDELWHRWMGVESIESPLVLWSPPHALMFLSAMMAMMILAVIISRAERLKSRDIMGPAVLGMLLALLTLFIGPFFPTGPHEVMGTSGIGVVAAAAIAIYFIAQRLFPDTGSATLTAAIFIIYQMLIFDSNYYIPVQYDFLHIPDWLLILVYVVPAYLIDASGGVNKLTQGTFAGFVFGILFYGLGGLMIPSSGFTYAQLWTGTLAAALGGMIAGLMYEHLIEHREQPN
jgi:hypothetical protein